MVQSGKLSNKCGYCGYKQFHAMNPCLDTGPIPDCRDSLKPVFSHQVESRDIFLLLALSQPLSVLAHTSRGFGSAAGWGPREEGEAQRAEQAGDAGVHRAQCSRGRGENPSGPGQGECGRRAREGGSRWKGLKPAAWVKGMSETGKDVTGKWKRVSRTYQTGMPR